MSSELATLAGGCFWCLEAVYQDLKGVTSVVSGYSGGREDTANYQAIGTGQTKHAEVVQVEFDPEIVSFKQLVEIFFFIHDPTTPNRQGNDVGPQYRSAIFYHDETQKETTEAVMEHLEQEKVFKDKIITELNMLDKFYLAEGYHQNYYKNNSFCPF
ncbi:MAG: peptide-methionine (S)-S-oxide reductase MsrA [Candidatus Heimdallarchaeota archaeon]|nr:peptide-methionine (S)-S-oxide reductase MsrA [Candidatus Heimdallarchaeota archaeon]